MPKVILIVMDGVGIGELPDAGRYKDEGSNTLSNLSKAVSGLSLPCLEGLGLGNLGDFKGINKVDRPLASYGIMAELSAGKDTITGHWEMMGVISERAFPTYPYGFPQEIIKKLEEKSGRKIIGNRPASGTEIIKELGEEHLRTGSLIVYTSADSVFQIAAHENVISVEELYAICKSAREILRPPHNVARVIARPFRGNSKEDFRRTPNRKDFSISPPEKTVLDLLFENNIDVISVGKVSDMFAGRGFTKTIRAASNTDSMTRVKEIFSAMENGLIFTNLVDFDTLYGHRNDPNGFYSALKTFDRELETLLPMLKENDYLILTADHGCDPTTPSTDHSREYVPLLLYNRRLPAKDLGRRESFSDIGATIAEIFGLKWTKNGSPCL